MLRDVSEMKSYAITANINIQLFFTVFVAIPESSISIYQYSSSVYVCTVKRQPSFRHAEIRRYPRSSVIPTTGLSWSYVRPKASLLLCNMHHTAYQIRIVAATFTTLSEATYL